MSSKLIPFAALFFAACGCPQGEECQPVTTNPTPIATTPPPPADPSYEDWVQTVPGSTTTSTAPSSGATASANQPQYDDGTLGIKGKIGNNPITWGQAWSWSNTMTEGFFEFDLSAFPEASETWAVETSDTPGAYSPDFTAKYKLDGISQKIACTPSDTWCMAEGTWSQVSMPATSSFPLNNPQGSDPGVHKLVEKTTLHNQNNGDCTQGTTTTEDVGWRYRVRTTNVQGQAIWHEMWFVIAATRARPDNCSGSSNDLSVVEHYPLAAASPPVPRTFVEQLNGSSCGTPAVAWCNACANNACQYIDFELKWWEQQ